MAGHFKTDEEAAAWLHNGMQRAMVEGTTSTAVVWLTAWMQMVENVVTSKSELQRAVDLMQCASSFRFTLDPYQDKYIKQRKAKA